MYSEVEIGEYCSTHYLHRDIRRLSLSLKPCEKMRFALQLKISTFHAFKDWRRMESRLLGTRGIIIPNFIDLAIYKKTYIFSF